MQFGGAIRGCCARRDLDEQGNDESLLARRACRRDRGWVLQPGAPVPHAGAAGGRVAVGCDNFSRGGNPMRHFVTQSVTRIVNNNERVRGLAQGSALGDCARILRR